MSQLWPTVVPVALAMASIYLLLPRVRPYRRLWGGAIGGLALVLTGLLLVRVTSLTAEAVLFYAFSGIAVVAGTLLVTQSNPVRAALSFALVVLSTCGLFLLQAAPFLMAAATIIYAGAIIVTFLFVIMLAQQAGVSDADLRSREPLLVTLAGFLLLGGMLHVLSRTYDTRNLEALLQRTSRAAQAPSFEVLRTALGDEEAFLAAFLREWERAKSPSLSRNVRDAIEEVKLRPAQADLEETKKRLQQLHDAGVQLQESFGSLQPRARPPHPLSSFSGPPANEALSEIRRDASGRPQLPAENVAYLGRSLFTDYLLAVELVGMLLLVAAVGAIAIAGRKVEGPS